MATMSVALGAINHQGSRVRTIGRAAAPSGVTEARREPYYVSTHASEPP